MTERHRNFRVHQLLLNLLSRIVPHGDRDLGEVHVRAKSLGEPLALGGERALDTKPPAVRRLEVEDCAGGIIVRAEGFQDGDPLSPKLSAARRLLEFACQRSIQVLAPGTRMMSPQIMRPATRSDAA